MMRLRSNIEGAIPSPKEFAKVWKDNLTKNQRPIIDTGCTVGFIVPPEIINSFIPNNGGGNNDLLYVNKIAVCTHSEPDIEQFIELIGFMVTVDFMYSHKHQNDLSL